MKIWGLDIGSTGIKAIKLVHSWQGYRIASYACYPFRGHQNLMEEKKQILDKIFLPGEKGKNIILSFPSARTMVHRLALPFAERRKNEQVIKFAVEPLLPFPIEEVIVDFFPQANYKQEKSSLIFAVKKADLRNEFSFWEEVGLDPESLIPEAVSLFWLARFLKKTDDHGALVDLGAEKATLIAWRDGGLALARALPVGEREMNDYLQRLSIEIQRTLLAYESDDEHGRVEKIWLTGGRANWADLREKLLVDLKRPVALLDLGDGFPALQKDVPEKYHHALAVALGSALWEEAAQEERLNLRREEFISPQRTEKVRFRLSLLVTYGIILALMGLASLGVNYYLKERRYRELKNLIRQEFLQAYPGVKKVVHELQQMKNLVQEEKIKAGLIGGMGKGRAPLEIIYEVSAAIEPTWKMRITELTIDAETIEIVGEADSFETANRLKSKLDNSHLFKDGQLKAARAGTLENTVEFKLQMKKKG